MAAKPSNSKVALLGDIGGTNVRLALWAEGRLGEIEHFSVAEHPDPLRLMAGFLAERRPGQRLAGAVLAAAGPLDDDGRRVRITNSPWVLDAAQMESALPIDRVRLINDFAAIAWALTRLGEEDLFQVGSGRPRPGAPRTVLGPGTGLGVAHLLTVDGRPVILATEGGHATMAAADAEEAAIFDHIRAHYGHVSGERVLSGEGILNLHRAVAALAGSEAHADSPEAVTAHAAEGCATCGRSIELFLGMLGGFAGNLALTLNARGGVFIAGGIVPRLVARLESSGFRGRFEAKGRYRDLMRRIPTYVVEREDVAFEGLIGFLQQGLA